MAALLETTSDPSPVLPRISRAFGLTLELGFEVPGLPDVGMHALLPARRVRLRLAENGEAGGWTAGSREVLVRQRLPGRDGLMLLERVGADLLLRAPQAGSYLICDEAREVRCAPPETDPWRWQAFLVGQVLPLVTVLRGLEVLHASAVVYGQTAVAFCGHSGTGKTSVAASLIQRGASILTDDVLALESSGDGVLAHPGPRLLGGDRKGARVIADRGRPVPLAAICVIERRDGGKLEIERLTPTARMLLATTFNFAVRSPARLATQLDVHARLARTAVLLRARVPSAVGARSLAMRLEAEVAQCAARG